MKGVDKMECPKCGRKCFEGVVKSEQAGILFSEGAMLTWTPEYEKKSIIKKDKLNLKITGSGYYCQFCEKVYATFELSEIQSIFQG